MEVNILIQGLNNYFSNKFKDKGIFLHKLSFNNTRMGAYKEAQLDIYYKELKSKAVTVDTLKLVGKVINDDKTKLIEAICVAFMSWMIENKEKINSYGI